MQNRPFHGWVLGVFVGLAGMLFAGYAHAGYLHGFYSRPGAIDLATDIVEVVPVKGEPGALRVVSVWRGTLEEGFVFDASEIDLREHSVRWDKRSRPMAGEPEDLLVVTSYVLFLRDTEVVDDARLAKLPEDTQPPLWIPANTHHLSSYGLSALYIEEGRAYGLAQAWGNPGPLVPVFHCTKAKWHRRVKAYDQLVSWLDEAKAKKSADELAEIYADAVDQGFLGLVEQLHAALKTLGNDSIEPIQRNMLHQFGWIGGRTNEWSFRNHRPEVYELLAEIDHDAAQAPLRRQAQHSKYHFDRVLKSGLEPWADSSGWSTANWQEYTILATVLQHIKPPTDEKTIGIIQSIREQWRDERLFIKESRIYMGLNVLELCDRLLDEIDAADGQ